MVAAPDAATADEATAAVEAADEEAAGAETAGAEAAELPLALPPAPALELLLHADRTSAIAPIPAMVAIALLTDVRDTRPPPFLWGESCEGAHNKSNESASIAVLQV